MNDPRDNHLERQLRFLQALAEQNASIGGDVLEIHQDTWVIHGIIPVDGEVLMAEFETTTMPGVCSTGFATPDSRAR